MARQLRAFFGKIKQLGGIGLLAALNIFHRIFKPRDLKAWARGILLFLLVLYIIGGFFFGLLLYAGKSEAKVGRYGARIYPFPVAIVNGEIVWLYKYLDIITQFRHFSLATKQTLPEIRDLRRQVTDQMIEEELYRQEARKFRLTVTPGDVDATFSKITQENGGEPEIRKVLKDLYGMDIEDFKRLIFGQLIKERVQQKLHDELLVAIKGKHILLNDEGKAKDILEKAKKGDDFGILAQQNTQDQKSKDKYGDFDWGTRGTLPKPFEDAAFSTLTIPSVFPDLVKTDQGFEIIKVEARRGSIDASFDQWLEDVKKNSIIIRFYW